MTLSVTNTWYKAEIVPASQKTLVQRLAALHGVGLVSMGTRGNTSHTSGYHRSRNWILKVSDRREKDYSVQLDADRGGDPNWTCAVDGTPGEWGTTENRRRMIQVTTRLINAAKAHDPRLGNVREIAGTLDGRHVVTWDCSRNAFKDPFDTSHLDHYHVSLYRSQADHDHSGIYEVIAGIPATAGTAAQEADDMDTLMQFTGNDARKGSGAIFVTNGKTAVWVRNEGEMTDRVQLHKEGTIVLGNGGKVRTVGRVELLGYIVGACPKEFADRAMPGASAVATGP